MSPARGNLPSIRQILLLLCRRAARGLFAVASARLRTGARLAHCCLPVATLTTAFHRRTMAYKRTNTSKTLHCGRCEDGRLAARASLNQYLMVTSRHRNGPRRSSTRALTTARITTTYDPLPHPPSFQPPPSLTGQDSGSTRAVLVLNLALSTVDRSPFIPSVLEANSLYI